MTTATFYVYFTLGKKKSIEVRKVKLPNTFNAHWQALFKASARYGKNFKLIRVTEAHENGETQKISSCSDCGQPAGIGSYPFCPHGNLSEAYAQRFAPVVVHVDATGNYRFPGRSDAKMPAGYEKVELRSLRDVRAFERQFNAKVKREFDQRHEVRQEQFEARQSELRSELRDAMAHMSRKGREFAQFAIDRNNQRARKSYEPNGFFEAFEMDASNREGYSDRANEWKSRK